MNILALIPEVSARHRIGALLMEDGHVVQFIESTDEARTLLSSSTPDCFFVQDSPRRPPLSGAVREVLRSTVPDRDVPIITAQHDDAWRDVLRGIDRLWKLTEVENRAREKKKAMGDKPNVVLLLDEHNLERRGIAHKLHRLNWKVLSTSDVRNAALAALDDNIDCMIVSAELSEADPVEVMHSFRIVRDAHRRPFTLVVMVDTIDETARDFIRKCPVDGWVCRRMSDEEFDRSLAIAIDESKTNQRGTDFQRSIDGLEDFDGGGAGEDSPTEDPERDPEEDDPEDDRPSAN